MTLAKAEDTVKVGSTLNLAPSVLPINASDKTVTYSSKDDTIATVDASGVVTGVKVGDVEIGVTSKSNPTVTAKETIHVVSNS